MFRFPQSLVVVRSTSALAGHDVIMRRSTTKIFSNDNLKQNNNNFIIIPKVGGGGKKEGDTLLHLEEIGYSAVEIRNISTCPNK